METKTRETNNASLFFQGMGTIGQIFPPVRQPKPANWASAWQGVGDAFAQPATTCVMPLTNSATFKGLRKNPPVAHDVLTEILFILATKTNTVLLSCSGMY
jgi:hypothetical protein